MKQYKKPSIECTEVIVNKCMMQSPGKSYDQEGDGNQLTRSLWVEENEE